MSPLNDTARALYDALHDLRPFAAQYIADNKLEELGKGAGELLDTSLEALAKYETYVGGKPISLAAYWDKLNYHFSGYHDLNGPRDYVKPASQSQEHELLLCSFLSWVGCGQIEADKPQRPTL